MADYGKALEIEIARGVLPIDEFTLANISYLKNYYRAETILLAKRSRVGLVCDEVQIC